MTLTKIVNSKLLAMLMGAWIAYCVGVGDDGGAVFLLFFYLLMLWDGNKKATSAGNTEMSPECIQSGSKNKNQISSESSQPQQGQGFNHMEPEWNRNGSSG